MGDQTVHYPATLEKSQLKPGHILNENLNNMPGMRQGYVLSQNDIDMIVESPKLAIIKVILQDRAEAIALGVIGEDEGLEEGSTISTIDLSNPPPPMSIKEQSLGIFDTEYNEQIKEIVDFKKAKFRGPDYEERVKTNTKKHLDKFANLLKSSSIHIRRDIEKIFEHHAKSETDIESIMMSEGIDTSEFVSKLQQYERYCELFMRAVLTDKKVYTKYVENIVIDILKDVGYKLQMALFAAISKTYSYFDYHTSHALQVLIISIITAIELSNMITLKIDAISEDDIDIFKTISQKAFTIEELVDLGIVALLHDITLKKQIPDLSPNFQFTLHQESIIDLHPSNSFHIAKGLPIDFEVQRAVYQHHERYDGSGYPSGLAPRFFTKFTGILMFAEYYVEQTTINPIEPGLMHPRQVLVDILNKQREKFDGDVVYAFIRAASLFPVGSWVMLSNDLIGVVIGFKAGQLSNPIVKIFFDSSMQWTEKQIVDTSLFDNIKITKPISSYVIRKVSGGSLDFMYEDIDNEKNKEE